MSQALEQTEPVSLFFSYAHEDEELRNELEKHLTVLKRAGILSSWHDRKILPGRAWEGEIDEYLESAHVILLLISPDYMHSEYCFDIETKRAVERHHAGEAIAIPVILRPVDWRVDPIQRLQALPTDAVPITSWSSKDEALVDVARGIRDVVVNIHESSKVSSSDPGETIDSDRPTVDQGPDQDLGPPEKIGRYRVERILGEGAFGTVYLAHDDHLKRRVAIKTPNVDRVPTPKDVESLLAEAQMVANLDHPHLVPVYDAGQTDDGLCFVVSKFIEGSDLATKLSEGRPSYIESAELVRKIADALRHAHSSGLVHRDIKPANILMDMEGNPYLADFGFALKEQDFGTGAKFAGTPAYMSPEQARGEGHRVDGRSDIFSLGVVIYELLTGKRPFRSERLRDLLDEIAQVNARPPRELAPDIPAELERICLKAMANSILGRYQTARDLAIDLGQFLNESLAGSAATESTDEPVVESVTAEERESKATPKPSVISPSTADSAIATVVDDRQIVPRGLRSFGHDDADFFLQLLPGSRDRDGLPESVAFWKNRIETIDSDGTFPVGLIYGPSGCGKTSLVHAGLLPRLSKRVIKVPVEAAAYATAARVRESLRKRCPTLPNDLSLSEALSAIRRNQGVPPEKKLLIVLDQFEQWLHVKSERADAELIKALRQCDGRRVQCLLMVRADFIMAIHELMDQIEIRIQEGENAQAVKLFGHRHAKKVLYDFGRAYGCLPDVRETLTEDQNAFLDQAVLDLSQNGKVFPLHLALFADMMKDKAWTSQTLIDMGGTHRVGLSYLEEMFESETAPIAHRRHQQAVRRVLRELLPAPGVELKGRMKSRQELRTASGYKDRGDFERLMKILDMDTRLVTPTELDTAKVSL